MLFGGHSGTLEVRQTGDGATRLRGRFPYNVTAVLSDGGRTGRPRKERIASRAFAYRVDRPDEDIHFLVGHDYNRPLASRGAGTLDLRDTDDALTFEARISQEMREVSYVRDFLASLGAGLTVGLSPGFRIPPQRAVPEAERIDEEPDNPEQGQHRALIRTVLEALLFEVSAVTRPAYSEAQIEARDWQQKAPDHLLVSPLAHLNRWRL